MNYIVTGLGFGDEGKGSVIDALCRHFKINMVVRHNGGGQAAHNVVLPTGMHHTFAQFGSNSFIPGASTFLSRHMMINPVTFINEANILKNKIDHPLPDVYIDLRCLVTTPYHMKLNSIREKDRCGMNHGTTGMGIGETVIDSMNRPDECLRIEDLLSDILPEKLLQTRDFLREEAINLSTCKEDVEEFDAIKITDIIRSFVEFVYMSNVFFISQQEVKELLQSQKDIAFEGAQGVLLDQDYGFHPHTTWSKTTPENAKSLCEENELGETKVIGVTRTYHTRHGAGPFPTESKSINYPEPHNGDDCAPGKFRQGYLDISLLKYAIKCCGGIDMLAVNHIENYPRSFMEWCSNLKIPTNINEQEDNCKKTFGAKVWVAHTTPKDFPEYLAEVLNTKLFLKGFGPSYIEKRFV